MARGTKQLVDAALYGAGDRRRFTLDSPILSDVWSLFFEKPMERAELLFEPWLDTPVFTVAEHLLAQQTINHDEAKITYNRAILVGSLSLEEIIRDVLPLTGWYLEIQNADRLSAIDGPGLPDAEQMWQDLSLPDSLQGGRRVEKISYPFPRLLGFIRMAGLIFAMRFAFEHRQDRGKVIKSALREMAAGIEPQARRARARLAKAVLDGWGSSGISLPAAREKVIYAISRNRAAKLAIRQSVRTVKGDAAAQLFDIDCSALTWAVVDSGIDANHPAFIAHSSDATVGRQNSRIIETYDFAYLRELLTARDWDKLPEHVRKASNAQLDGMTEHEQTKARRELASRIRRSRAIDWELLRPFLRIDHGADYVAPIDPHGTHVAGILGADWKRSDAPLKGMCPAINIIDIRVCRDDGSSDEFVIMSALQFIRYLNANSDRMAVHGINMSLSLEHDASVYACGRTPVCEEAERAISSGIVVVAAAGNHGYRRIMSESSQPFDQYCPVSITDPGNAENVITVGSTHRLEPHNYGVSYFSSRGPTGDGRAKPDLVAPGEKIFAPAPHNEGMRLDGTSMAAPHVSGAAAMLMARHVELVGQPQRIKQILCSTATDLGRESYFQGKGLVDVLRAIQSV